MSDIKGYSILFLNMKLEIPSILMKKGKQNNLPCFRNEVQNFSKENKVTIQNLCSSYKIEITYTGGFFQTFNFL